MKLKLGLSIWLWLICVSARAALVENLYTVEVAVPDQSTAVRLDAFKQAFRDVIIKVTGSEDALQNPGMKRPLKSSSRYVLQFRYEARKPKISPEDSPAEGEQTPPGAEAATSPGATPDEQLYLRVTFNQDSLENLLRSNNISIWGKQRPSTLLLVSEQQADGVRIVSGDTAPALMEVLSGLAEKRGLPVLFPLMDLEDRQQFSEQDVVQGNLQALTTAAARYAPDALLVGQLIAKTGQGWQAHWLVRFSEKQFEWRNQALERKPLLDQAMKQLARLLASEYALQAGVGPQQDVLFSVDQVLKLTDVVRVLAYLKSLDAVADVRLLLIDRNKVSYRVKLRNSSDDLARLIALGDVLEQLELPQIDASSGKQTISMNYRLIR